MYSQWINITERDLIQKGISYSRVKNVLKLDKLVLNMTLPSTDSPMVSNSYTDLGDSRGSSKAAELKTSVFNLGLSNGPASLAAMSLLAVVSGQRPILTKARKSIANWKVRKNQVLGFKVTLRGTSIFEFLDKTVRFQNLNLHANEGQPFGTIPEDTKFAIRGKTRSGLAEVESFSIGIKNINVYPELEDSWLAQNLISRLGGSALGFNLSLKFKKQPFKRGLINRSVVLAGLRKLYLTSLGLYFKV